MAEDDIYGNKGRYESFKANLKNYALEPSRRVLKSNRGNKGAKYYCKNPANLKYFSRLFVHFEAKDLSFIRRMRILHTIQLVTYVCEKDLGSCERRDIDGMMAHMHETYASPKSKETFIKDLKYVWRILFPEMDEKGRPDETMIPYAVRHLSAKIDKSRQKLRKDRLSWEEYRGLVDFFSSDARMQLYLNLAVESLARPQELLYLRLSDIEPHDNYAKIWLSEHGKEGTGLLQCIDSYPYLLKWLREHPTPNEPGSFLFLNTGNTHTFEQLRPENVNKMLRYACARLGIDKRITCYSLKRNGVTFKRNRGASDADLMHTARWTSTQQLKTYDMSTQEDAFQRALQARGMKPGEAGAAVPAKPESRICPFCNSPVGFTEKICPHCQHLLDREAITEEANRKDKQIEDMQKEMTQMRDHMSGLKQMVMTNLADKIMQAIEKA